MLLRVCVQEVAPLLVALATVRVGQLAVCVLATQAEPFRLYPVSQTNLHSVVEATVL